MMHHPPQFGSNLNEPDPVPQYSQHPNSFEAENNNTFNPKGNVAALRSVIHGQLDMKTPTGKAPSNSSRYQKPAPPPVDPTPSWAKNVKVYEPSGYVDPHLNKHNMGRVLDGPVNPNKFFQGVPPPSYSQVKPGTDTKPPAPPSSKPPIQTPAQALQAQVLHNEKPPVDPYRPSSKATSYRIPYDAAMDPRHHFGGEFDIDDSASIISSSCTFGDSSEIAAFSAAAEQRHLYEQYRKKLMEEKNELKEGSETPCVSLSEKIPEKMTTSMEEPTVSRSLFDTELTPFGHTTTTATTPSVTQNHPTLPEVQKPNNPFMDLQNLNIQNSPKQFSTPSPNPFNYSPNSEKRSIDLESSQLLVKPKSPAPYSTSSSDHYGTIRRKHKPVAIELSSEPLKSSPKDRSPHFFGNSFGNNSGNGNGFEEKTPKNHSPLSPSYKDQQGLIGKNDSLNESLNQAFQIASAIESTKNNYEAPPTPKSLTGDRSISDTYPVSSPLPPASSSTSQQWIPPPSTTPVDAPSSMSNSMMSTSVPNMDDSIVFQGGGGGSADSSPDRHEDMSQWYRKMFKQMHKKGDEKEHNNNKEEDRFGENNNNRASVEPKQLGRSQENLSHQNPRRSKTPESFSLLFEHFEHGPSEQQQNFGQERVKPASSNEDELLRLRAEKLAEELKKEKDRKHGFVPSATPSLQNNMDRLNSLLYDFSSDPQETNYKDNYAQQQPVMTATAVYKFEPRSSRELPLNRGDIVRIIRDVDAYWMEGERNGRCGIFPNSYVQINSANQSDSQKMRAIYPFTARSETELSLKRGEIVTRRRQIDSNWLEGSNQIGIVGIFPASYVEPLAEPAVPEVIPPTVFPNRPKTPKMEDQVYNTYNRPVEQVQYPQYQYQQTQQQQYPQQQYPQPQQQQATVAPNNKVRFDLPSSSDSNLNTSLDQIHNYPSQPQQQTSYGGMKKIEYEREKVDEEPILDQYRKLNEPQETKKKETNILMNAASLIPKGSEMYRAVYPYQPQKDDELQLFTNDIIFVVERCDDGWYIGTSLRTGEFGIFPGNYVKRH